MAFVTLKDYSGGTVDLNPAFVQSVTSYDHYDHDMELPAEFYFTNNAGLPEVRKDKQDEADVLRTSPRTLVVCPNASYVVQGSVAEVKKALG